MALRRPEDTDVRIRRVDGDRLIQVGPPLGGIAGPPTDPAPVGQGLGVGRLDLQHPGVESDGLVGGRHAGLDQQGPGGGPDVSAQRVAGRPVAGGAGHQHAGQDGHSDHRGQHQRAPWRRTATATLPPPDRRHPPGQGHAADHDRKHPDQADEAVTARHVVDVLAEPVDQHRPDLAVGTTPVDHGPDGRPDGPGDRYVGLTERLPLADRTGEIPGQVADAVGVGERRPLRHL